MRGGIQPGGSSCWQGSWSHYGGLFFKGKLQFFEERLGY